MCIDTFVGREGTEDENEESEGDHEEDGEFAASEKAGEKKEGPFFVSRMKECL